MAVWFIPLLGTFAAATLGLTVLGGIITGIIGGIVKQGKHISEKPSFKYGIYSTLSSTSLLTTFSGIYGGLRG